MKEFEIHHSVKNGKRVRKSKQHQHIHFYQQLFDGAAY